MSQNPTLNPNVATAVATKTRIDFALGIPHTPWRSERITSLRNLLDALYAPGVPRTPAIFEDREPNWSWSFKLWSWAAGTDATHLVQLQDDVKVRGPEFWEDLERIVSAAPDQVIGLESVHPVSELLHRTGGSSWYTTTDGLIGVAYVFPIDLLKTFLYWRETALRADAIRKLNEDQLIGIWTASTGRRIYHPVPTIVDHDIDLPSTYGNDAHSHRRPPVTTVRGAKPSDPDWKLDSARVIHTGCFYGATGRLCRRWVRSVSYQNMWEIRYAK